MNEKETRKYVQTNRNLREYYKEAGHNYAALIFDGGCSTMISSEDRTYHAVTSVDEKSESVTMEIWPHIHCCKEARGMMSDYIDKINDYHKIGNLRLSNSGEVSARAEQHIGSHPIPVSIFKKMEMTLLVLLGLFENVLDKIAGLRLLDKDEVDPGDIIKKYREASEFEKALTEDLDDEIFDFGKNSDSPSVISGIKEAEKDDSDEDDFDENDLALIRAEAHKKFKEMMKNRQEAEKGDTIVFPSPDSDHAITGRLVPVENETTEPTSGLLSKLLGMADESECELTTEDEKHTDEAAGGDDGTESE